MNHCQKCNGNLAFVINRQRWRCNDCKMITDEYGFPPFYNTIVNSKEWESWKEQAIEEGWDWPECTETDCLSPEHWSAFCNFLRK